MNIRGNFHSPEEIFHFNGVLRKWTTKTSRHQEGVIPGAFVTWWFVCEYFLVHKAGYECPAAADSLRSLSISAIHDKAKNEFEKSVPNAPTSLGSLREPNRSFLAFLVGLSCTAAKVGRLLRIAIQTIVPKRRGRGASHRSHWESHGRVKLHIRGCRNTFCYSAESAALSLHACQPTVIACMRVWRVQHINLMLLTN